MAVFHAKYLKPWNRVHWFWRQMTVLCTVHVLTGKCNKRDWFSWLWDLHWQDLSTIYLFLSPSPRTTCRPRLCLLRWQNYLKECAQSCQADQNIIYTNLTAGYPHRFLFQPCTRMSSFQIFVKTLILLPEEPITA